MCLLDAKLIQKYILFWGAASICLFPLNKTDYTGNNPSQVRIGGWIAEAQPHISLSARRVSVGVCSAQSPGTNCSCSQSDLADLHFLGFWSDVYLDTNHKLSGWMPFFTHWRSREWAWIEKMWCHHSVLHDFGCHADSIRNYKLYRDETENNKAEIPNCTRMKMKILSHGSM